MNMMKALIPSTILTLILSAIVGAMGSAQGFLNLQTAEIGSYQIHWSWTFFFLAMTLNGLLVLRMSRQERASKEETVAGA